MAFRVQLLPGPMKSAGISLRIGCGNRQMTIASSFSVPHSPLTLCGKNPPNQTQLTNHTVYWANHEPESLFFRNFLTVFKKITNYEKNRPALID